MKKKDIPRNRKNDGFIFDTEKTLARFNKPTKGQAAACTSYLEFDL